jgi:hypothetical protein
MTQLGAHSWAAARRGVRVERRPRRAAQNAPRGLGGLGTVRRRKLRAAGQPDASPSRRPSARQQKRRVHLRQQGAALPCKDGWTSAIGGALMRILQVVTIVARDAKQTAPTAHCRRCCTVTR